LAPPRALVAPSSWCAASLRLSAVLLLSACTPQSAKKPVTDRSAAELAAAPPVVTVACAPQVDAASKSSGPPLGLLHQPAYARVEEKDLRSAVYDVGEFPENAPPLRPGPEDDRRLLDVYCVGCHSTAYIAMQPPLTRAQWEAEVQKMRSAFGAVVPDPAAQRIATFLHAYYGRR
jgi:hypothetical protein